MTDGKKKLNMHLSIKYEIFYQNKIGEMVLRLSH